LCWLVVSSANGLAVVGGGGGGAAVVVVGAVVVVVGAVVVVVSLLDDALLEDALLADDNLVETGAALFAEAFASVFDEVDEATPRPSHSNAAIPASDHHARRWRGGHEMARKASGTGQTKTHINT